MKTKKIILDSKKDYDKFLKKLCIYKTFFYKKTKFCAKGKYKNPNIDIIINALNIKNRNARIEYVYDQACKYLDCFIEENNICDFKDNMCFIQRNSKNNNNCNGCCKNCIYQKNKVCTTKNISCKLFYCPSAKKKKEIPKIKNIYLLKLYSFRQRILYK